MALSGSFKDLPVSWFGLKCTWSGSQSISGNYTDITLNVVMNHDGMYMSATTVNVYIDGDHVGDLSIPSMSGNDSNTSGTFTARIYHNSNGTRSLSMAAYWPYSVSTNSAGTISNLAAETEVTLDQIDRTAPTVSHSVSSITTNGFTITVTSSANADRWDYSVDGGSTYTQFSTTSGTTQSVTVTDLSPGVLYNVRVRARKKTNQIYGYSTAAEVRTLGASSLEGASDFAADANPMVVTINLKVTNATFHHKLRLIKDGVEVFSAKVGSFTAGTEDRAVTLTATERNALLTAMSTVTECEVYLEIQSYETSAYLTMIGSASNAKCKATTSANLSAPTFTSFSYADIEAAIVAMTGNDQVLLQLHSFLRVTCTAGTAKNGATITGYSATIGDASSSSATNIVDIPSVNANGELTLTVTCSDSRGYGTTISKTVKVLPYQNPEFSSFRLRRENDIGSRIQLAFHGAISSLVIDDVERNEITAIAFRYKKTSEETWGEYVSLMDVATIEGNSFSYENLELLTLDTNTSYNFEVQIQDALYELSSLDYEVILLQGTPAVAIRKANRTYSHPRVGINNALPKHALDVGGDIAMNGFVVLGFRKVMAGESFNDLTDGIYFYNGDGSSYDAPVESPGFLTAITDGTHITHRFSEIGTANPEYVRTFDGKTWSRWTASGSAGTFAESEDVPGCFCRTVDSETEWLNPPMELSTEYRTAERFMGVPVYTMLVDAGVSYGTSVTEVQYYDTYAVYPIRCNAQLALAADYPMRSALGSTSLDLSGNTEVSVCATNNKISYVCNDAGVGYQIYVQVWYTKTLTG